ncbi:MAG: amidohydrolase family protein [Myxococcota bacterium]|nr:amidohydrolase family protein [Myxococcota bacterium]
MSETFRDFSSIDFPIIDCDSHVNEPPDLWLERVASKWKDRVPRVERVEGGEMWFFDGGKEKWPVGLTAVAGLSFFDFKPMGVTYETMRPGSFDTKARLEDMDADGIYAQILYPSVTLKGAKVYGDDRELQVACVRAYNEWLTEFCEGSGGRLVANAIVPTTGVDDAIAEVERALSAGHRGCVISSFPNGSLEPKPEDDRFWAFAESANLPISVHIGSFIQGGFTSRQRQSWSSLAFVGAAALTKAGGQTLPAVCDILFSGIFQRFPRLKILLVESNIGWIPTLLEQADDMFMRYRWYTGAVQEQKEFPSDIFQRNFWATFMVDTVGMDLRHRMNIDHLMWSTDYPHSGSDWPHSRLVIERVFRDVPRDQVKKMLHDNCKALYGLDDIPSRLPDR